MQHIYWPMSSPRLWLITFMWKWYVDRCELTSVRSPSLQPHRLLNYFQSLWWLALIGRTLSDRQKVPDALRLHAKVGVQWDEGRAYQALLHVTLHAHYTSDNTGVIIDISCQLKSHTSMVWRNSTTYMYVGMFVPGMGLSRGLGSRRWRCSLSPPCSWSHAFNTISMVKTLFSTCFRSTSVPNIRQSEDGHTGYGLACGSKVYSADRESEMSFGKAKHVFTQTWIVYR